MKSRRPAVRCLSFYVALAVLLPVAAGAQQQQNANLYAYWTWSGNSFGQNLDQEILIKQKAASTYWASLWALSNSSGGGYIGLQTNGNRFDGSTGDTAIFSLWGATKATGSGCGAFGGEGTGLSCRLAYPIAAGRWYRLRVWKISASNAGVWWGAWVEDETTKVDSPLGQILVPANQSFMSNQANFSEYFGAPVAASKLVPQSQVVWSSPSADQVTPGKYSYTSTFSHGTKGTGTTGLVKGGIQINTPVLHNLLGVQIVQGG